MTAFSIPEMLYEEGSFGVFLLVSIILGGGAAALSGRAIAATWRPWWQIVAYSFILGLAVRFIHFSLFDGTLLSAHYYLVDSAVCMAFGSMRAPAHCAGAGNSPDVTFNRSRMIPKSRYGFSDKITRKQ